MVLHPSLTPAGELLLLLDQAPRCRCGSECETFQYMRKQVERLQMQELRSN
jgi:hypothetical protein